MNAQGQEILDRWGFGYILERELEWHQAYKNKELGSDKDLHVDHVYKLHYISYKDYHKFLLNASAAKASIGEVILQINY